jgi:NAD(P)-dependent dehydrogenase (short-subunit alcohol dehydrogenase family)
MASARTVVVTGGGRGLGASIARAFHDIGDYVAILSRADTGLAAELGSRAHFVAADVRDVVALRKAVGAAVGWTGRLDVMINNAGYSEWRPLRDVSEEFWGTMIDTNLKGVLFACQAAVAHLRPGGCIINMSSLAGKRGSANNAVYCASKFGVNGITQALAKELGRGGIRVNAVCPVYVRTDGLMEALKDPRSPSEGRPIASYLEAFAASQSALGTLPSGSEIAQACVFLASEAASAITGQCINVDCGVLPQ